MFHLRLGSLAACGLAFGLAAAAYGSHWVALHNAGANQAAVHEVQAQYAAAVAMPRTALLSRHDIALRHLTQNTPDQTALIQTLRRAGSTAGVAMAMVSFSETPAARDAVGRRDMVIALNGDYASVKAVLAEVLDRYPSVVVRRLNFRRTGGPADLQAQVALQWLSSPQEAEPAALAGR